ncbi:MAG: YbhB/YbcL family Raf kinase inhibitor-like protein [bacterium]
MRNKITWLAAWAVLAWAQSSYSMELKSNQIKNGQTIANEQVFDGMGFSGGNISPELRWTKGPTGTKSYALMVYDPDAPTGSGWWHWVVFNIPADQTSLPKNFGAKSAKDSVPMIQSRTDFGTTGYGGPAPPPGKPHHYRFTIYALKVKSLPLTADTSAAMVGFYVNANKLASATLVGLFGK